MILQYNDLENLLKHADEIKGVVGTTCASALNRCA